MTEANALLEADRAALARARRLLADWGPGNFSWNGMDLAPAVLSALFHGYYRALVRTGVVPQVPSWRTRVAPVLRAIRWRLVGSRQPSPPPGGVVFLPTHPTQIRWMEDTFQAVDQAGGPVCIVLPPGVQPPAASRWIVSRLEEYAPVRALAAVCRVPQVPTRSVALDEEATRAAAFLQRRWWPQLVLQAAALEQALLVHRPQSLLVMDDHGPLGMVSVAAGRKIGVRSVNLQHGWIPVTAWTGPAGYDAWAVFGPHGRRILIAGGERPEVVAVTGPPHCDRIVRRGYRDVGDAERSLGLPANQPERVLFVSQWGHLNNPRDEREASLRSLLAAVCTRPRCHLIVKKHPVEHDTLVEKVVGAFPGAAGKVTITRDFDLYSLLGAVQVVATQYSSIGYETALAGRPLLVINLTGRPDVVTYVKDGIALGAYSAAEVRHQLTALLDNPDVQRRLALARGTFIREHCLAADGRASERLAALLYRAKEG